MQTKSNKNQGFSAVAKNCMADVARFKTALCLLIIFAGCFAILIGSGQNPNSMSTDSGVFAYCGQQILQGQQLYQDCWDNKPPGVYYLNTLAILLTGNTPGSIWLFQSTWMALYGVIFYLVQRRIWGNWIALVLTGFTMLTVFYPGFYQGGNYTETYVLLPITLQIWAFWRYLNSGRHSYLVWMGLMTASAFLLKPSYISVGLTTTLMVFYLDIRRRDMPQVLQNLFLMLLSVTLPLVVIALYFAAVGGLDDLIFAVFTHNIHYVQSGFSRQALHETMAIYFQRQPLASISALAGLSIVMFLLDGAARYNGMPRLTLKSIPQRLVQAARAYVESGAQSRYLPGQMEVPDARYWLMFSLILSIPLEFAFI